MVFADRQAGDEARALPYHPLSALPAKKRKVLSMCGDEVRFIV